MAMITPYLTGIAGWKPSTKADLELSNNISENDKRKASTVHTGHPYVLYLFNYFSIFCLTPYWIRWDQASGRYVAVSNLPKKLLSCVVTFAGIIVIIWDDYWKSPVRPFMKIAFGIHFGFEVVVHLFTAPISWVIVFNLWFRIDKVVNWITEIRMKGSTLQPILGYLICFVIHCTSLRKILKDDNYMCFFQVMAEKFATFWSFRGDLKTILAVPINTHDFLCNTTLISTEENKDARFLMLEYGFKILYICLQRLYEFHETSCFVIVLSLWTLAYKFGRKLNGATTVKEGIQFYKSHRHFWDLTNELFGVTFLCFYVASLAYYALIQHWFKGNDVPTFAGFAIKNVLLFGMLCNIHHKIRWAMRMWINARQEVCDVSLDTLLNLHAVSHEIETDPMGISCFFFTFSFQFLGSMFGLLITYAIIIYETTE